MLAAVISGSAAAEERVLADAGCQLSRGETGLVAAVRDGTTVELAGGAVIRLAGIAAATALDEGAALRAADAMRLGLGRLVAGRTVELRYGAVRRDRYGRTTGQLFVRGAEGEGEGWVQAALLDAGLAQVAGFADDRACLATLLEHERAARSRRSGLWRESHYRPLWAGDPSLRLADGLYAQVEGRVESVGTTQRTIFLNFGRVWSRDLTVIIRIAEMEKAGLGSDAFAALEGSRIRVRGWVTQRDGPLIRVDHPEQIEVLEHGNVGSQSGDRPDG